MPDKCERCGNPSKLEKHRVIHGINGGKYEPGNIRMLCKACHDYQHAKDNVVAALERERKRIAILEKRLELIESLNPAERLAKGEPYQSYFDIFSEALPPQIADSRSIDRILRKEG